MRKIFLAGVVSVAASAIMASGVTAGTSKGGVGRAFADAYVQVEQDANIHTRFPQVLGILTFRFMRMTLIPRTR